MEEHRVVGRRVVVLLRTGLDPRALLGEPPGTFVHRLARGRAERQMMDAEGVAVIRLAGVRLPFAQPDGEMRAGTSEVHDALSALAGDRAPAGEPEWPEQTAVEHEAALE